MKIKPSLKKIKFKLNSKVIFLLFVLAFIYSSVSGQMAVPVSGGSASGEAGFVTYTVGQAFYTTATGDAGVISQGVQQPFEISAVTGTNELRTIDIELTAYPNPTADFLTLDTRKAAAMGIGNLEYRLYDMNSRLLHTASIATDRTIITMGHLEPAVYFVKVTSNNLEIKSFKIIKK